MQDEYPTVDDVDPLMSIGAFSRASFVSVKALRAYHESGLLVPDSIDPATGYRRYRVSQLTDAAVIRRLRDLDLPLREVAEIVAARDPEITREVIALHQATMERRLEEVAAIVDELQAAVERPAQQTPVHTRVEAETHALTVRGTVDERSYGPFLDDAFGRLFAAAVTTGAVLNGTSAARYPATYGPTEQQVEAYLPVAVPERTPRHDQPRRHHPRLRQRRHRRRLLVGRPGPTGRPGAAGTEPVLHPDNR